MPPQPLPAWLEPVLIWWNYPAWHHWSIAWTALGLVALLALRSPNRLGEPNRWWQHPFGFWFAVLFAFASFRWPSWFVQNEFNPDESTFIAAALTLRSHPLPWLSVDTMTAGPVTTLLPAGLSFAGLPLNFFGARVLAMLVQAGALFFTWATLRPLVSVRTARLGLLPALVFWCFTSHHDFLHYSSELAPLLLIACAGWLLIVALVATPVLAWRRDARLFLSGTMLGLVPFAKLQGVPPAGAVAVMGFAMIFSRRSDWGWRPLGLFLAGGVAAPLLIVIGLVASGALPEAWNSYILNNLWYVSAAPETVGGGGRFSRLWHLVNAVPAFRTFCWGSFAFVIITALPAWVRGKQSTRVLMACAWGTVVAGAIAVLGPGRMLPHYLEFLVIPLTILTTAHLHAFSTLQETTSKPNATFARQASVVGSFAALTLFPQGWTLRHHPHLYAGQYAHNRYEHPPSQAAYQMFIRRAPGDTLAMWGWCPQLYVETGLPQGTREAMTERQLLLGTPMQPYYLARYLADMRRRRPTWFVDAVGPRSLGFKDRTLHGHEQFPELRKIVDTDYAFFGEIENLRIYRRR